MRISGKDNGYTLLLSPDETYGWAHRLGVTWPCSRFSETQLMVQADRYGICELVVDGRPDDGPGDELEAIVADHLPVEYRHLWPVWDKKPVLATTE
jgi:hypothetical protein